MGKYSMFLERRKADTAGTFTEAKQSFSVPAPGKYRLSLNCCNWAPENTYAHLNAFAQLIQPGGVVTNALKNFKPNSFAYGLEGIRSFAVDTETLTTYGAMMLPLSLVSPIRLLPERAIRIPSSA